MMHKYSYNDRNLMPLLAAGDMEAYRVIYDYYFPIIYHFILKWVKDESFAKDITQDVFVAVWEKRTRYATVENFRTYLFKVAKNATFDTLKKLARRQEVEEQQEVQTSSSVSETSMNAAKIEGILEEVVAMLPDQQKRCYSMAHNGLPYKKIGKKLGIAPDTVKRHIVQANKFIRDYITQHYHIDPTLKGQLHITEN